MLVDGAINFLIATIILVAGWVMSRWLGRWLRDELIRHSHYIDDTLKPLLADFVRYAILAITWSRCWASSGCRPPR